MVKKGSFTGSRFSLDSSPLAGADIHSNTNNNSNNLSPFLFRRRSSHSSATSTTTGGSGGERSRRPSELLGLSPSSGRRPSELLGLSPSSGRRASEVLGLSPASVSRQASASAAISMSEASRKRISLDVPWWRGKKNAPRAGNPVVNTSNGTTTSPRYVNVRATDFIDASVNTRLGAQTVTIEPRPAVAKPRPPSIEFPPTNARLSPGKNVSSTPTQVASPSKPPTYVVDDDKERIEKLDVALEKAGLKESPDQVVADENRDASLENVGLRRLSSNARDDIDTSISSWSERASSQKPPVNDILWPRPERPNLIIKSSAIPPIAARCFYPSPPPLPTPPMSERSSFTSECALRSSITETDSDGHISGSDNESTTSSFTENILRQSWNKNHNPANSSMTSTVLSGSSSDDDNRQKKKLVRGDSAASGNTSTIAHRNQADDDEDNINIENDQDDDHTSVSSEEEEEEDFQIDSEYGGDVVDSEEEITKEDPRVLKAGMVIDGDETETESDTETESEGEHEYEREEAPVAFEGEEEAPIAFDGEEEEQNESLPFLNISEDSENEPFVNASEDSSSCKSSSSGGTCAQNDSMTELLKRTEKEVEIDIAAKKKAAAVAEDDGETYGEDGFSEAEADDLWSDSEPSSVEEQRQMIRNATPLPKRAKKPSKLVARFFDPDNEAETCRVPERTSRKTRRRFSSYASSSKRISKGALAARLKSRAGEISYLNGNGNGGDRQSNSSRKNRPATRKSVPASMHISTSNANAADPSPSMDLSTVSVASSDEEFDPNMD